MYSTYIHIYYIPMQADICLTYILRECVSTRERERERDLVQLAWFYVGGIGRSDKNHLIRIILWILGFMEFWVGECLVLC